MKAFRTVWRKLGRHDGVLVAQRIEYEKSETVAQRERDRHARRTARIERTPDWETIQRLCNRDSCGLGGTIADIIDRRHTQILVGDVLVAAVRLHVYCYFTAEDFGWSKAEMKRRYKSETVSDGFWVTLYRNPKMPQHLKATIGQGDVP